MDECIKMWYIYTMDSAIKKNEILPFATTWMDLGNLMLGEINQRKIKQHDFTHLFHPSPIHHPSSDHQFVLYI